MKCHTIWLPTFQDRRGKLTVSETGDTIPFEIKRVFTLTECSGYRGGHVNPGSYVLQAVVGHVDVRVENTRGYVSYEHELCGNLALYTPPDTAVVLKAWSPGAVVLVLSDWHYKDARP